MRFWKKKVEVVPVLDARTKRLIELTDKLAREEERERFALEASSIKELMALQAREIAILHMAQSMSRGILLAASDK